MKIYLITDYRELDGVLDIFSVKEDAEEIYDICYRPRNKQTHLIEIKYDGRIYNYDLENEEINFFEKIEC